MIRTFFFLLGFGLAAVGFSYIVVYLNLFTMGYSFDQYFAFICKRPECIFGVIGFIILSITIFCKGDNDNVIHL